MKKKWSLMAKGDGQKWKKHEVGNEKKMIMKMIMKMKMKMKMKKNEKIIIFDGLRL